MTKTVHISMLNGSMVSYGMVTCGIVSCGQICLKIGGNFYQNWHTTTLGTTK